MSDWWKEALERKEKEGEDKFNKGEQITPHHVVASALLHPEKFDIQVKLVEN